jgi:hypothetical protein
MNQKKRRQATLHTLALLWAVDVGVLSANLDLPLTIRESPQTSSGLVQHRPI